MTKQTDGEEVHLLICSQWIMPLWSMPLVVQSVPLHFLHLTFTGTHPVDQWKHLLGLRICNRLWGRLCLCNRLCLCLTCRGKNQASLLINTLSYWNSFRHGLPSLTGLFPVSSRITPGKMIVDHSIYGRGSKVLADEQQQQSKPFLWPTGLSCCSSCQSDQKNVPNWALMTSTSAWSTDTKTEGKWGRCSSGKWKRWEMSFLSQWNSLKTYLYDMIHCFSLFQTAQVFYSQLNC